MDATQIINDSLLESDEEENEDNQPSKGRPVAKLHILKNEHMPETELPLFLGENVLGRDGSSCTACLPSPSVSKRHAIISISLYRSRGDVHMEALVWDLGSLNGTRKGRLKLTPNVRYALSEQDSLVLADIPCQFVSSSADTVSPQHNLKTSVSVSSVVDSRLTDASNKKESGPDVGSEQPNRAPEAKVSSPPRKDTKNTPVGTICLSLEQTPTQVPQGTLVPESDVDSDEERESRAIRRRKTLGLDSDSILNKSSPTCTSFLSPTNKIVPESEDESLITPPISTKNRPPRHVSFNKEETNINVGRQQLKEKAASEEEDAREALEGRISSASGPHVLENQECSIGLKDNILPVSTPAVIPDAFKMDSDTDLEGEEEGVISAIPVTLTANQRVDDTSGGAQFYMDSDTDAEENDDAPHTVPEAVSPPENKTRSAIPAGIPSDSDTDVEDKYALEAVSMAKSTSMQSKTTAEAGPTTHLKHFHLDSDTESEEDDPKPAQNNSSFKITETPTKPETVPAALPRPDSETDDEAVSAVAAGKSGGAEPGPAADTHADLDILSDSGTDVEPESPLVKQTLVGTDVSLAHGAASEAVQSDSDADTDVEESSTAPVLERVTAAGLHEEGQKAVGDEGPAGASGEGQVPRLVGEDPPGLLRSSRQYCSTPVQLPENQVEHMETLAFLSPTSERCAATPTLGTKTLAFDSESQEDGNVFGAETQAFVFQPGARQAGGSDGHIRETTQASAPTTQDEVSRQPCREESFRLGLFDSSHLQDPLQALVMESTQAFVSVEATQLYAAPDAHANKSSSANDSELEATQAYGEEEEPAGCSVVPDRGGRGDFSLEPTQAYVSDPYHDSEEETDDDERRAIATDQTQPFYFPTPATLATAETQPMCAPEEEEVVKFPVPSAVRVKVRPKNETEERGEPGEAVTSQERPFREVLPLAETQPMCTGEDSQSDDEDSFPGQRRRKAKQLPTEDEQTQPLSSSERSLAETQPLPSADGNLAPPGSEAFHGDSSVAETQLMTTGEDEESISFLALPRWKARLLRYLEEDTQRLAVCESSLFETQPMNSGEGGDGVDSLPGSGIPKPLQIPEEKTQLPTKSTQHDEPGRRRTRGRKKAETRGKSKSKSDEREEEQENEEEEEELPKEAGDLKSRQQRSDVDKNEPDISPMKKQGEPSLGERSSTDLRENGEEGRKEAEEGEKKEHERIHVEIKEEKERIEVENAQRLRFERERAEREKTERERKEQEERAEKRQKETEEKERLELERAEREHREKLEGEKHARMSSDGTKQEKKEMWESERREHDENLEREVQHHSGRQESEAKEPDGVERSEKGGITEEKVLQEQKEEDKAKVSTRGRRAARRAAATQPTPMNDDVPARRTRSRSNSSNSVSSERSASSVHMQESGGRGRGRGARRTSDAPPAVASRSSNRRKTVAAHPTQVDRLDVPGVPGGPSRPNSSNSSLNQSSQGRGRVSRRRPRGGTAEEDSVSPAVSQSDLETTTRGRKNNKPESSLETEKADAQQATAARGRWRSGANGSGSAEAEGSWNQGQRSQEGSKRNVRGRSQNPAKREALVVPGSPAASKPDETKELRKGRKRESEADTADDPGSSAKSLKGEEKEPASGEAEEAANQQEENKVPVQAKRRGRASAAQTKKVPKAADDGPGVKERNEGTVEGAAGRGRGRLSVAQKKTKAEQPDPEAPVDQRARVLEPEVRSPASGGSRKRQAPVESSPLTKTPRSSSLSPGGRSRMLSHTFKVLFTCVVDEAGERVLARLGGSMAKGVADMNCLVTDKVRRTVKFLCAVAKGIPVVTTQWLEKSGKAGGFLPPSSFVVKDEEQEKKFSFCLQESLLAASRQPLLQGYQIHVTKSVKPEPVHMKDILSCSGASFLPKMPSSHKALTVVISCEEDWHLCAPALSASVPVVTAEFVLTGILQQKLDVQTHALCPPASSLQPAAGRARGRRKT